PTSEQLANYAAACGYKELRVTEAPSPYHTLKYREYDDYITTAWYAPALESLKASLKIEAEAARDESLSQTTTLSVEGIGEVVYNQQAQNNVMGSLVLMQQGAMETTPFILADDSVLDADITTLTAIGAAIATHVANIYALKTATFTAIDAAESVEELLLISN
ncbi:MAG: DUF4376 domain-containing protein, partial [Akkermansia sp.]